MSEHDCLFCKILAGTAAADVVYQDNRCVAVRDTNPQAPTHILIIPKEHVRSIAEIDDGHGDLLADVAQAAAPLCRHGAGQWEKVVKMNGFGLSRERFALLFSVMLVAAAGNTAMQSLLPAIGRELGVADIWVAIAFSLSAVVWVAMAPVWARRADRRGRRALMRLGLYGFIVSMLICGLALAAGLAGLAGPMLVFAVFMLGRTFYGFLGSASPSAVQSYIAARTEGEQRTAALAAIASSFGLGTIIGPAIAPLFIVAPLGLSAPLFAFAFIAAVVLALIVTRLAGAENLVQLYQSLGGGWKE